MKKVIVPYQNGYVLEYFFRPGLWMNDLEKSKIIYELRLTNKLSGMNLNYAIFNENTDTDDFLSRIFVCLMRKGDEVHGFFFSYLISEEIPFVHQGLIAIHKNDGVDLFRKPYQLNNYLIRLYLKKDYYTTNITATPKSIGLFCDLFTDVWPSPYGDQSRCPYPKYKEILKSVYENYVTKFFPHPELLKVNFQRFILKSAVKEMGFDVDVHDMSRDHRFEINVFTHLWIRHLEEEDVVQVGRFDEPMQEKQFNEIKDLVKVLVWD